MSNTVSFEASQEDAALIRQIAQRAVDMDRKANGRESADRQHHSMNIRACHANGNPLRLADLLAADDFNFAHDVFGIDRHISRETGQLGNHFSPRFSKRMESEAA